MISIVRDIFVIIIFAFAMLFLVQHQKIEEETSCQSKCGANAFHLKKMGKQYLCVCTDKSPGSYKIFNPNGNKEK